MKFFTLATDYLKRNGEHCKIVKTITEPDEKWDAECLPVYEIQFDDGTIIDGWPDEVKEDSASSYWS